MKTTSRLMIMMTMLLSIIPHGQAEARVLMREPTEQRSVFDINENDIVSGYLTLNFMGVTDRPVPVLFLITGPRSNSSDSVMKEAGISLQEFKTALKNTKAIVTSIPDSTVAPMPLLEVYYGVETIGNASIKNDFMLLSVMQGDAFYENLLAAMNVDNTQARGLISAQAASVLPPLPEAKITEQEAIEIARNSSGFLGTWTTAERKRDGWHIRSHSKSANPPNLFIVNAMTGEIMYKNMNTDEVEGKP